jgi:hypothetical protein
MGLDVADGAIVLVEDPQAVNRCVKSLTEARDWQMMPGPVTEGREVKIALLDAKGILIDECYILGELLVWQRADGTFFKTEWPAGIEWAMSMTNVRARKRR